MDISGCLHHWSSLLHVQNEKVQRGGKKPLQNWKKLRVWWRGGPGQPGLLGSASPWQGWGSEVPSNSWHSMICVCYGHARAMCTSYQQRLGISPKINTAQVHRWCNNPLPHYAAFISCNMKLLNEQICYEETKDTETKQVWTISFSFLSSVVDVVWNNCSKKH